MYCEITYQTTGERWGIFPRDIGEFQAKIIDQGSINQDASKETIIKRSVKIEIMSCSFTPDEKNRRHREALSGLVDKLLKAGWETLPEQGAEWYSLRFYKSAVE